MKIHFILISLLSFLLICCATVEMPSGGPIDKTPPKLITVTPRDSSIHFSYDKIIFIFDEFIKPVTKNKVNINPYLSLDKYEIATQGKKVIITFDDTLSSNTTYTITFNEAIIDITEGNILKRLTYSFSTGDFIDTCTLSGKAILSESDLPMSKGVVILNDRADFNWDSPPLYLDYCLDGIFLFTNLPTDSFYLYTLEDLNNNLMYEINKEHVGFYENIINLSRDNNYSDIEVLNFIEFPKNKRIISNPRYNLNNTLIIFNQPLNSPLVAIIPDTLNILSYWNENKDTLSIFYPITSWDTTKITIKDFGLDTTINILTSLKGTQKTSKDTVLKLSLISYDSQLLPSDSCIIKGSLPFKWINTDSIILIKNEKDTMPLSLNENYALYHTIIDKLPNGEYELIIKNNAAYSIAGTTNKEEKIRFSKLSTREVSMLEIKFSNALKWDGIIKLNGKYFKRSYLVPIGTSEFIINELLPDNYELMIVKDDNNNGKYDTGNFEKRILPERVYRFPKKVEIIKNRDQSIIWDL